MTRDYLWKPLVYIGSQQIAYLLHPGSAMTPIRLNAGWVWHWPVLSTIRVVERSETTYSLMSDLAKDTPKDIVQSETVVCVSRDYQLFVVEGHVNITIDELQPATMPGYMKYSPTKLHRHIQSLIRQSLRKAIAEQTAKQLHSQLYSHLQSKVQADLDYGLRQIDIQVKQISVANISVYSRRKQPHQQSDKP